MTLTMNVGDTQKHIRYVVNRDLAKVLGLYGWRPLESFHPLIEVANCRAGGNACSGATQCSIVLSNRLSLPWQESSLTAPGAGAAEGTDEEEGGASEEGTRDIITQNGTPAQAALLEVWMGLQGYGVAAEGEAGAATTAFSKLRKALDLKNPDSAAGGSSGAEDAVVPPVSSLEVHHEPHSFVEDFPHVLYVRPPNV